MRYAASKHQQLCFDPNFASIHVRLRNLAARDPNYSKAIAEKLRTEWKNGGCRRTMPLTHP
jgi:hypothetical protein